MVNKSLFQILSEACLMVNVKPYILIEVKNIGLIPINILPEQGIECFELRTAGRQYKPGFSLFLYCLIATSRAASTPSSSGVLLIEIFIIQTFLNNAATV
jgi:hypothetical protein